MKCTKLIIIFLLLSTLLVSCGGGTKEDSSGSEVLGALVLAGVVFAGKELMANSGSEKQVKSKKEDESMYLKSITSSVYDHWRALGEEPKDFGVYTYVLFGRFPAQGDSSPLFKKYKVLLELIQEKPYWRNYKKPVLINEDEINTISNINTGNMNIYLIPTSMEQMERMITISTYNFDYSARLINTVLVKRVHEIYSDKFMSEGPFLISMPNDMQSEWKQHMLFADLTNVSEDLVPEVFTSYEKALKTGSNVTKDPFGILENIRIDLGQKLVNFNAIFNVFGEAYAGDK